MIPIIDEQLNTRSAAHMSVQLTVISLEHDIMVVQLNGKNLYDVSFFP